MKTLNVKNSGDNPEIKLGKAIEAGLCCYNVGLPSPERSWTQMTEDAWAEEERREAEGN